MLHNASVLTTLSAKQSLQRLPSKMRESAQSLRQAERLRDRQYQKRFGRKEWNGKDGQPEERTTRELRLFLETDHISHTENKNFAAQRQICKMNLLVKSSDTLLQS